MAANDNIDIMSDVNVRDYKKCLVEFKNFIKEYKFPLSFIKAVDEIEKGQYVDLEKYLREVRGVKTAKKFNI
jgi:hypothetical protein